MSEPTAPRLHPSSTPRDAATVVLLRDAPGGRGVEVYLVQRSRAVDFMAGAYVFPGGRLDRDDSSPQACLRLGTDAVRLRERLGEEIDPMHAAGLFVAAVRETFEEAGLMLGRLAAGWDIAGARRAAEGGALFATLVESIDAEALVPWVRWVTPEIAPKRFDARFFLARAPKGQTPSVDGREAVEGLWISPQEALGRWEEGTMQLVPATAKTVELLLPFSSVADGLAQAAKRPPPVAMPHVWNDRESGRAYISLPGDPMHPLPDNLGGEMRRFQVAEGRYLRVKAV